MNRADLNRVQEDLNLMKATLGGEFPYDRRRVVQCLLVAGAGIIICLMAVSGWRPTMRIALVAYFCLILAVWFWQTRQIKSEQAARPRAWNWTRRETWASGIAMAFLIPYVAAHRLLLEHRDEWTFVSWRDTIAAPVMFFVGVAVFCISISARELRGGLGWGVAAILAGIILPWCQSHAQTSLVLGVGLIIGGIASAAILAWQIRTEESFHAAD